MSDFCAVLRRATIFSSKIARNRKLSSLAYQNARIEHKRRNREKISENVCQNEDRKCEREFAGRMAHGYMQETYENRCKMNDVEQL